MSKEKKPILNLQKGCPFCGGTDLCYRYDPALSRIDIVCKACNFTILITVSGFMIVANEYILVFIYGQKDFIVHVISLVYNMQR